MTNIEQLAAAVLNCAEYLEEIIEDECEGGCASILEQSACCGFCENHGCAKARVQQYRKAIEL